MTVHQLIAKLSTFPPDAVVVIDHDGDRIGDARSVKVAELYLHDKYEYAANGTGESIQVALVSGDE